MRFTGHFSATASQAASRSADGESAAPATDAEVTLSCGGWSIVAASSPRQRVILVQDRSVSPGR